MTEDKLRERVNMVCDESTAIDRHTRRKNRLKFVVLFMIALEAVLLVIMKLGFEVGLIESIIVLTVLFLMIVTPFYLDYTGVPIRGQRGMDEISRDEDELLEEVFEPLCRNAEDKAE
ncbi:MAG: hypothetical protein GF311_28660 [Candidatus Lokiarchaeota archaeon]|nr:hypothetical protein [Candidatus Lokiarchaeota archaeon]